MRLELTKRGDYAVRAMIALGHADPDTWLSASGIASQMHIPVRFLPQVMADLARAELVASRPGRSGGYRLARAAAHISILDVIDAVETGGRRQNCVMRGAPCGNDGWCVAHSAFAGAQDAFLERLASTTLASLVPAHL